MKPFTHALVAMAIFIIPAGADAQSGRADDSGAQTPRVEEPRPRLPARESGRPAAAPPEAGKTKPVPAPTPSNRGSGAERSDPINCRTGPC
jgi:hypothetical protein